MVALDAYNWLLDHINVVNLTPTEIAEFWTIVPELNKNFLTNFKQQKVNIMNKSALVLISSIFAFSTTVMAENVKQSVSVNQGVQKTAPGGGAGSLIEKSVIVNQSINKGNVTVAVGRHNQATTGSVYIKGSTVKKSVLVNQSINKGNVTLALGRYNKAHTGSLVVLNSKVKDSVLVNQSVNKGNVTLALGRYNTAATGSIIIE